MSGIGLAHPRDGANFLGCAVPRLGQQVSEPLGRSSCRGPGDAPQVHPALRLSAAEPGRSLRRDPVCEWLAFRSGKRYGHLPPGGPGRIVAIGSRSCRS
ncbi:MAG TPA: hypothetical protein DCQ98_19750 [Planctomycetaceae bacterium]|nr:hypothetical protein [Planctomycetaceae bacterium]